MKHLFWVAILFSITLISCKKKQEPSVMKEILLRQDANHGNILTDKEGRSLYFFANDANGQNTCTGSCETGWPVFYIENISQGSLAQGLLLADFKTITTAQGKKQLTYKGWPLYYYAPMKEGGVNEREMPLKVTGDGFNNAWFVAKPDYSIMIANTQLIGADGKNYLGNYTEGNGKTAYFTNDKGLTLYTFSKDSINKNKFTKADFSNNNIWPIYETDKVNVPSILNKAMFSSISVFGKKQLTYKGWPLYYFGADNQMRGSNKGISQPTPGTWPVAVKEMNPAPEPA